MKLAWPDAGHRWGMRVHPRSFAAHACVKVKISQ
jgi:hypothetical protein